MSEWRWEVAAGPFGFTEGPAWDGQRLLFSDIPSSRILYYDPETAGTGVYREGTNEGNGLMFDPGGRLYGCQGGTGDSGGRRLVRYEPDGAVTVVADSFEGRRLNSPNDLAFDAEGNLWFSDPRYGDVRDDMELEHESIYRVRFSGGEPAAIERMTFDTTRPNGLLIAPGGSHLYVAQSEYGEGNPRELRAYPICADGTLGDFSVLHNFYPHRGIDGMCLDIDGNIVATAGWNESGPGPMIYVFAPDGRVLETAPVPFDRPTNCTWGGAGLTDLYVTTATAHLLRVCPGRRGRLDYPPPG